MTNMELIMEPESTTLKLDNVVIRATDRFKQPGVYIVYLDISDKDGLALGRYGKRITPKKSKVSGMWYYIGYMDSKRFDFINNCVLSDGGKYFIPHVEFTYGYFVGGKPETFRIVPEDLYKVHEVDRTVYDKTDDISKEENKMATTYDAKTGKKYYDYTQASAAYRSAFGIDKVVYSPPATIVFWKDGSKTVVKCSENDVFDPLAGIAMALMRKVYGKEYRKIEKYAKEYEKLHPAVDISAMAGCVMSEKEYWDDVFATYDDTHDVSNDSAPAKKVGETTVDDSELKSMSFDTVGGEMVKRAVVELEKELSEENDNGTHE